MSITSMIDEASAQIEIVATDKGNRFDTTDLHRGQKPYRLLALASFYWQGDQDWPEFVQQVTSVADRMFAEFNNEAAENVTQYIQFKTGGVL